VTKNTVADLLMESGETYRCIWTSNGRVTAWWPLPDQKRKRMIALYEPVAWRQIDNVFGLVPRGHRAI